jgi:hypothetical protein
MRGRRRSICAASVALLMSVATPASADVVDRLTLKEKVGQLVMFSVQGKRLAAVESELIRKHHLGGVILFGINYSDRSQLRALNDRIQRVVRRGAGRGSAP